MPFTAPTKPNQGDATRKALADALIDNDTFFNSLLTVLQSVGIPNGSFEYDGDSDGSPDEWTETTYTGGSFTMTGTGESDTDNKHGKKAIKFTATAGGSNGGGEIITDNFFEVTPNRPVHLTWLMKSSVASVENKVQILFYTDAESIISTVDLYSSSANSTSWIKQRGSTVPPSTARLAKVKLIGANKTGVAGDVYFDDVRVNPPELFSTRIELKNSASQASKQGGEFIVPDGVTELHVQLIGPGGNGGNGGGGQGGSGGGGGGYCQKIMSVDPGDVLAYTVGLSGENTTFDSLTANSGSDGTGTGGAGGTASGGDVNESGTAGTTQTSTAGRDGGKNFLTGCYGVGGPSTDDNGGDGGGPGGGGGGGANSTGTGGTGGPGLIVIHY